jgi:predicted Abi (CAAX) family protease
MVALAIGFGSRWLEVKVLPLPRDRALKLAAGLFLLPAVVEELVFRVLLLPQPSQTSDRATWLAWGTVSLVLFVLYHPLNALTLFPAARQLFMDPLFLLLAAGLGVVCSVAYWLSGSLWTPVAIHWIVVVVWLLFLGGYERLYANSDR